MNNPVGMSARSSGFKVTGSSRFALKSMPALPEVSYCGSGYDDRLMILTSKVGLILPAKVVSVPETADFVFERGKFRSKKIGGLYGINEEVAN